MLEKDMVKWPPKDTVNHKFEPKENCIDIYFEEDYKKIKDQEQNEK